MSVSILMVRALIEAVEHGGVSRARLLAAAGLEPERLDDTNARLAFADYGRVQHAALELSGDPALGLHLGELTSASAFDLIGHLTDHAATLREAITTITRYSALLSESPASSLHEEGETATLAFAFPRIDSPHVRLPAELALSGMLKLLRLFVGPDARPRGVFFAYKAPDYRDEYARTFGGLERFEQTFTGIVFERAWLARTQLHKNAELYALLEEQAQRSLGRLARDGSLARTVMLQLTATDPKALPAMDGVARALGMSARSLRRRLSEEGVAYRDLVERARAGIAQRMLQDAGTTMKETAFALGFATPAAFQRAFKRWTGMTPGAYRTRY
jgi:AraC-like DNA-binding protein